MPTTQTSIAFSGDIPAYYDAYLGPMFFEPYALDLANRIGKLSPTRLLELASGTGRLTKLLPAVLPENATIIASDINPSMVTFGKNKVQNHGIKWLEIDAVLLPFPAETFDAVVAQFGVMFYSDRVKAYQEAFRVLKPGGTFMFTAWDEIKYNPMANLVNETLQQFFPVDTPAFYSVPFSYYDEKIITKDLNAAGFKDIKLELTTHLGYSQSASNAAMGLIHGTPTISAIQERDPDKLPLILEHLERKIIRRFGTSILKVPIQARVVTAVKGDSSVVNRES